MHSNFAVPPAFPPPLSHLRVQQQQLSHHFCSNSAPTRDCTAPLKRLSILAMTQPSNILRLADSLSMRVLIIACGLAACRAQLGGERFRFEWPGLTAIQQSANACDQNQWNQSTALLEIETDMSAFLDSFDRVQPQVLARISEYGSEVNSSSRAGEDLKPMMEFALATAELYEIPGLSTALKAQLATRVRLIADAVLAVRNDATVNPENNMMFMWVE